MDSAFLSAVSALTGSLIGGLSTLAASIITQRRQFRAQALIQEATKREALYAEFIKEASRRRAEAWGHQAESPRVIAGLYSGVERMRLWSSDEVIRKAEHVIHHVIDTYASPDRTFEELRQNVDRAVSNDPIKSFSEACRRELEALLSDGEGSTKSEKWKPVRLSWPTVASNWVNLKQARGECQ